MNDDMNNIDLARRVMAEKVEKKQALAVLLDEELARGDRLLVERTMMGGTEAYVGSVSLQWLAERVGFASQLPLFDESRDPKTSKVKITQATIDLVQQRPLDWSRQAQLAQYLAARTAHKFPPVLVVISRPWVDNPEADEWNSEKRAVRSAADFEPLDSQGHIGVLDISENATIFALDGQHRLMGIQGLMELARTGELTRRRRNGRPEKKDKAVITIESLETAYGVSRSFVQSLQAERIGVEFISAVVSGETREQARRRVRSIFVHVNRMAAPLTKGQIAQLDEDDGFSIVARLTAVGHPFLKSPDNRVEWDRSSISDRSAALTTLQALKEMAGKYMSHKFPKWQQPESGLIPMRPEDDELDVGLEYFGELWGLMATLPSYKKLQDGVDTGSLRRLGQGKAPGEGHMLFRPVGQEALAEALGLLLKQGADLESLFGKLRKYDQADGFRIEPVSSPWYMVLYDPNKNRMSVRGKSLAVRLLVYLLGGVADEKERKKLRQDLAEERTISTADRNDPQTEGHEGQAKGFDGEWINPDDVELPEVIEA